MKAKNNIPPALLTTQQAPHIWTVRIVLPRDNWAELKFSQKDMAVAEYNKIRAAGVFGAQWIQSITLDEHAA